MREDIQTMSLKQMELILKFWDSPGRAGIVKGKVGGAVAKELHKKGYIIPAGKIGRNIRWQLIEDRFSKKDISLMRWVVAFGPVNIGSLTISTKVEMVPLRKK